MNDITPGLATMRGPFPPNQISYLPKGGVKLAFVGHAALTDRLLDADPNWTWEPLSLAPNGLPAIDESGGLWIRLTVCGVTRLGYGDAGAKKGGDAMKERIGDALRNAAMRFGAALDLWHKGELHAHLEPEPEPEPERKRTGVMADVLSTMEPLTPEETAYFKELAANVTDLLASKGRSVAFERVLGEGLDNDQTLQLWSRLPSNVRSALKAVKEARSTTQAVPA